MRDSYSYGYGIRPGGEKCYTDPIVTASTAYVQNVYSVEYTTVGTAREIAPHRPVYDPRPRRSRP